MKDPWELAHARARSAVELRPNQPFDDLTLSVFLKYFLLFRLEKTVGSIEDFRSTPAAEKKVQLRRIAQSAGAEVRRALAALLKEISGDSRFEVPPSCLERIDEDEVYPARVAQLAVEQYTSERVAPELCVAPLALSHAEIVNTLRGAVDCVVLFESFTNFTNELYPLIVDAYESDLQNCGIATINVIGAHIRWWDERGRLKKGIILRHDDHRLIETDFDNPRRPATVLSLCMGTDTHQSVSTKAKSLGITDMNPYEPFGRAADNKYECYRCWTEAGVATPSAILIPRTEKRGEADAILEVSVSRWKEENPESGIVVQPNRGTEGEGVVYFPPGASPGEIREATREIAGKDDVLVRREVKGIRFAEIPPAPLKKGGGNSSPSPSGEGRGEGGPITPTQPPPSRGRGSAPSPLVGEGRGEGEMPAFPCDLRVNVTWNGKTWHAESGYLQVSPSPDNPVTSPGRGGRIVRFNQGAADHLAVPKQSSSRPFSLSQADWEEIRSTAIAAAARLPGKCAIVGVDVRLVLPREASEEGVVPWVLDANPRPAGLAHSEFLPMGKQQNEPGVTREIWKQLRLPAGT